MDLLGSIVYKTHHVRLRQKLNHPQVWYSHALEQHSDEVAVIGQPRQNLELQLGLSRAQHSGWKTKIKYNLKCDRRDN